MNAPKRRGSRRATRSGVAPAGLALLCLAGCASTGESVKLPVDAIERARFVAMTRQDTAALEPLLAADLVYCHSNGQCEDKAGFLGTIESGRIRYKDIRVERISARDLGGGACVLNGIVAVEGEQAGQAVSMRLMYTDVYVKRDGRWQLTAWQSTRLP